MLNPQWQNDIRYSTDAATDATPLWHADPAQNKTSTHEESTVGESITMKSFKRLSSWFAGAVLLGLGLAVAPGAAANAAAMPAAVAAPGGAVPNSIGAAVEFRNVNSRGCVDVVGSSLSHGGVVREFSCHNGDNQNWLIEPVSSAPGFVALRNINSNMCLDLRVGDISQVHDGTTIQQWDCFPDSIQSERWQVTVTNSGGPGALTLTSAARGLCLDTNPATGSQVLHVATCKPGAFSQMWREQ